MLYKGPKDFLINFSLKQNLKTLFQKSVKNSLRTYLPNSLFPSSTHRDETRMPAQAVDPANSKYTKFIGH